MPVHLKEIHVQNLGPLKQITLQLGRFNLIYGHNERGKTYLVEFVIRSLFRNTRQWPLRSQTGGGKVVVAGLTDGRVDEFSPLSPKKLEDLWEEANIGLPPDFSKLLVVKGAEVELANVEGGVDKAILKRILSSREVLDKIEKKISKNYIQELQIENGVIIGHKQGENKKRIELEEQLSKIDRLFDEIDKGYSGGGRKALAEELDAVQTQIDRQLKAKQYLAYQLDFELKKLREERSRIPTDMLQQTRKELDFLKQKTVEYRHKQDAQREAESRSQNYEWLKSAREVYQNALQKEASAPKSWPLMLSLIMTGLVVLFAFLKLPILALTALAGVIGFGFLYVRKLRVLSGRSLETQEIENLKKEFRSRFQRDLTGILAISEILQNIEEDYNTARLLKKQLSEEYANIKTGQRKLEEQIAFLANERKDPKTWDEVLRLLENRLQTLDEKIHEKDKQLDKLDVDHSDYQMERPDVEYSKQKLDALKERQRKLQAEIETETRKLESLKQRICDETRNDIATPWEMLINNLREKREHIAAAYKQKTAEIIGKKAVHEVIIELRKTEDEKIVAGLKSPAVQEPLHEVTGRYRRLDLDGESLVVSDQFNQFHLSELSTGAQEQVLLALRIGFSTKLMNRDSLFLILDDAFQYSDWERRKLLTDKVAALAQSGWQIIYFTMDDNIRELFDEKGKMFGGEYKVVELKDENF